MTPRDATDIERWEPWQRAYRHGAFFVFPPPDVGEQVDALRAEHDPISHAICTAHISVTEPLVRPLSTHDVRAVGDAVSTFAPFRVSYTGPRSTDPHPGVVYWIEPQDLFGRLRQLLHRQSLFRGTTEGRASIPAHMTIAEFLTVDESNRLAARLAGNVPEGTWTCDAIVHAVPDSNFHFKRTLSFRFGPRDPDVNPA